MTAHYLRVDLAFVATPPDDTEEAFDAFCDRVMDALCDLEEQDPGIIDPDTTASLANRTMGIIMGVEADSPRDAVRLFSANVRTPLHAARCLTPGWETFRPTTYDPKVSEVDCASA